MSLLARMIRNEKYAGILNVGGKVYTNVIPPIIDEELFRECNAIMDSHKHKQRKNYDEQPYILSGKVFCANGQEKLNQVNHRIKPSNQCQV